MEVHEIDTPVAVIDLDMMEQNIESMARFTREVGVDLRPHAKTHKVPEIAKLQIQAGARGITVQKLGEAEVMADAGLSDILISYQIVGKVKLDRLVALQRKFQEQGKLMTAVDSVEVTEPLSRAMQVAGLIHDVVIEVDTGLGRCGVRSGGPTVALASKIAGLAGLNLRGIMTHEGHVYWGQTHEEIRATALNAGRAMVETAELLREAGYAIDVVSVGSTPAALYTCTVAGISETRPGNYIFNDLTQVRAGTCTTADCALTVHATVISRPNRDQAVIDAGSKAMSSDARPANGSYGFVNDLPEATFVRASEEHGVLELNGNARTLQVGDRVEIISNHACGTVNMYDELIGVRDGSVEVVWPVAARGRMR
ncbi:MAG: alanine racemase [Candidatus Bipolaricaulia bacterium]